MCICMHMCVPFSHTGLHSSEIKNGFLLWNPSIYNRSSQPQLKDWSVDQEFPPKLLDRRELNRPSHSKRSCLVYCGSRIVSTQPLVIKWIFLKTISLTVLGLGCRARTQLLQHAAPWLWHAGLVALLHVGIVPQQEIKPTSPALQGRFLTAGPPGKSLESEFMVYKGSLHHPPLNFRKQNVNFLVVVQSLSHVQLFATSWTIACQALLSSTISWSLLRFMSTESVMLSSHRILCSSLFLLPSVFPSIRVFSLSWLFASCSHNIGASASAVVLPVNIQSWFPLGLTGLIPLLSKGLSRIFSSTSLKASVFQHSAFFMVNLLHLHMITWKAVGVWVQHNYYEPCVGSDFSSRTFYLSDLA